MDNIGRRGSYRLIGQGWGEAGAAPFFLAKTNIAEGGIHVPAMVSAPGLGLRPGESDAVVAVFDLAPTFVELAGGTNDTVASDGRTVLPMTGRPFAGVLRGEPGAARSEADMLTFEHAGQRAVLQGDWKALWLRPPNGTGNWQLFDVVDDPGETRDLAEAEPARLAAMVEAWDRYAEETQLIIPE